MNPFPPQSIASFLGNTTPSHDQIRSPLPGSVSADRNTNGHGSSPRAAGSPIHAISTSPVPEPGQKRKRQASSRGVNKDERKKVSRACDSCKMRKLKCSGTQPCSRCSSHHLTCQYNAEHRRGKPPHPELIDGTQVTALEGAGLRLQSTTSPPREETVFFVTPPIPVHGDPSLDVHGKSSRSSQEPDETRFEGHYTGPTSGIAFLHRAQRRFKQDLAAARTSNINNGTTSETSIFSFGDGCYTKYSISDLVLPHRTEAKDLLNRYFDFAMPTYRFLHRPAVEEWLERLCDENEKVKTNSKTHLPNAEAAICFLVLATAKLYGEDSSILNSSNQGDLDDNKESAILFTAAEHRLLNETGPVRLESVQAKLASCIYLLASSRINQAWYTFGTTTQMILALGLHRKRYSQLFGTSSSLVDIEIRKQVFWSAYTLDKYLSVILGRPRIFRDDDIDQHFPDRLNDAELSVIGNAAQSKPSKSMSVSDGPVFHAKLAKIVGSISSDLYPTNNSINTELHEIAHQHTTNLKAWKNSLPAFLEPDKVDPSMLIPIYQRQSTVLRLAYLHALIFANRPLLLNRFADLSKPLEHYSGESGVGVKECIDAAVAVVDIVGGFVDQGRMRKPYWFTHYISFCAIATLYVYAIQCSVHTGQRSTGKHIQHFDAAEKCQRSIYGTTAATSPFRRYNIILDELKREVMLRFENATKTSAQIMIPSNRFEPRRPPYLVDSAGGTPARTPSESEGLHERAGQILEEPTYEPNTLEQLRYQVPDSMSGELFDENMLDMGLYGQQSELVGWAEVDSCAIAWPDIVWT